MYQEAAGCGRSGRADTRRGKAEARRQDKHAEPARHAARRGTEGRETATGGQGLHRAKTIAPSETAQAAAERTGAADAAAADAAADS